MMRKRLLRITLFAVLALATLSIALAGISALSNLRLPTRSQVTDRLSTVEKARLAETIHLRQALGEEVWQGWGRQDIPIIVYNEEYAFLVDYPNPPAGWVKMPQQLARGGPWEVAPDTFEGQTYYRQRLSSQGITPESFTVLVGQRWVGTMQTKEYMEVAFYHDFRAEIPSPLRPIFPYRVIWQLLMGDTDTYIGGLEHETFHALQASAAPSRLAAAEFANQSESGYPWDNAASGEAWGQELDLLVRAVRSQTDEAAMDLVRQFLAQRDTRRASIGLSPVLVDYERQREWLEGLAKYAELSIERAAATTPGYIPLPALAADPEFKRYTTREQFWSQQIDEVRRTASRADETRFYYGGMAQAVLLDRLMPGWKERAFDQGVFLEDLLRQAVRQGQP
jgi:hypothetical protein